MSHQPETDAATDKIKLSFHYEHHHKVWKSHTAKENSLVKATGQNAALKVLSSSIIKPNMFVNLFSVELSSVTAVLNSFTKSGSQHWSEVDLAVRDTKGKSWRKTRNNFSRCAPKPDVDRLSVAWVRTNRVASWFRRTITSATFTKCGAKTSPGGSDV